MLPTVKNRRRQWESRWYGSLTIHDACLPMMTLRTKGWFSASPQALLKRVSYKNHNLQKQYLCVNWNCHSKVDMQNSIRQSTLCKSLYQSPEYLFKSELALGWMSVDNPINTSLTIVRNKYYALFCNHYMNCCHGLYLHTYIYIYIYIYTKRAIRFVASCSACNPFLYRKTPYLPFTLRYNTRW